MWPPLCPFEPQWWCSKRCDLYNPQLKWDICLVSIFMHFHRELGILFYENYKVRNVFYFVEGQIRTSQPPESYLVFWLVDAMWLDTWPLLVFHGCACLLATNCSYHLSFLDSPGTNDYLPTYWNCVWEPRIPNWCGSIVQATVGSRNFGDQGF